MGEYAVVICWGGKEVQKLNRALNSIAMQTLLPAQVLIVGDGVERMKFAGVGVKGVNLEILISPTNVGPALARNLAFGSLNKQIEYVMIQDADDISHPNRAQTLIRTLENMNLDLVGSQSVLISPRSSRLHGLPPRPTSSDDVTSGLLDGKMTFVHPSILFRSALLNTVSGYPPILDRGEDFAFLRNLAHSGAKMANVHEILYGYDHVLLRSLAAYRQDVRFRVGENANIFLSYLKHLFARAWFARLSKEVKEEWGQIVSRCSEQSSKDTMAKGKGENL